ncbi:unnamed protein product [Amoebophrya sp. A120]|nr:unnamed protein product [Amoebophrya sp. A120]|eukprot:GSA120T00000491001.1
MMSGPIPVILGGQLGKRLGAREDRWKETTPQSPLAEGGILPKRNRPVLSFKKTAFNNVFMPEQSFGTKKLDYSPIRKFPALREQLVKTSRTVTWPKILCVHHGPATTRIKKP